MEEFGSPEDQKKLSRDDQAMILIAAMEEMKETDPVVIGVLSYFTDLNYQLDLQAIGSVTNSPIEYDWKDIRTMVEMSQRVSQNA